MAVESMFSAPGSCGVRPPFPYAREREQRSALKRYEPWLFRVLVARPFVIAVRGNQTTPLPECIPERCFFRDRLGARVNLRRSFEYSGPRRHEPPAHVSKLMALGVQRDHGEFASARC
jgi:hypothetical protein